MDTQLFIACLAVAAFGGFVLGFILAKREPNL